MGKRGLHWGWVFVGVLVMVGGHVLAYLLLGARVVALVEKEPMVAFAITGGVALAIYFAGGLVVGRLSPGQTIEEPAIAGVIGLVVLFGLQLLVGMLNLFGLIIGAPFCFVMAYAGGWVGEKWQARSERALSDKRVSDHE